MWTETTCVSCGLDTAVQICPCEAERRAKVPKRTGGVKIMFGGIAEAAKCETEAQSSIDEMRHVIRRARRELAKKIWDFFDSIDKLEEKEFMEVIQELDGDGVKMSQLIEKFRKYKGLQ